MAQNSTSDLPPLEEQGGADSEDVSWGDDGAIDFSFAESPKSASADVGDLDLENETLAENTGDIDLNLGEEAESLPLEDLSGSSEIGEVGAENLEVIPESEAHFEIDSENAETLEIGEPTPRNSVEKDKKTAKTGHGSDEEGISLSGLEGEVGPTRPSMWRHMHQGLARAKERIFRRKRAFSLAIFGALFLVGVGFGGYWLKGTLPFSRLEVRQHFPPASKDKKPPQKQKTEQDRQSILPPFIAKWLGNFGKGAPWEPPKTTQSTASLVEPVMQFLNLPPTGSDPKASSVLNLLTAKWLGGLGKGAPWEAPTRPHAGGGNAKSVKKLQRETTSQTFKNLVARSKRALKTLKPEGGPLWSPPKRTVVDLGQKPDLSRYPWRNTLTQWLGTHAKTVSKAVTESTKNLGKQSIETIGLNEDIFKNIAKKAVTAYEKVKEQGIGPTTEKNLQSLNKNTQNTSGNLQDSIKSKGLIAQGKTAIGSILSSFENVPVLKNLPIAKQMKKDKSDDSPAAKNTVAALAPNTLRQQLRPLPKLKKPRPPVTRHKILAAQQPQTWVARPVMQQKTWQPKLWYAIAQANPKHYQDAVFFAGNGTWRVPLKPNFRGLSVPTSARPPRFRYFSQGYVVQVATFSTKQQSSAIKLTNRLIQQGYFAHLIRQQASTENPLEVRVGPFETREDAIRQTYPIVLKNPAAKNAWIQRAGRINSKSMVHGVTRSYLWVINVLRTEDFNTASKATKKLRFKNNLVYITQNRSVYGKFFYSVRIGYFANPTAAQDTIYRLAPEWPTVQMVEINQLEESLPGQPTRVLKASF